MVVNSNSAVAKRILKVSEELGKEDVVDLLCQQVYDLAMMSQSGLTGDKLQAFVDRSNQVLGKL